MTDSNNDVADYLKEELYRRIREDPEMFDWVQHAMGDGIYYWDLENPQCNWMSPAFKELFGYSNDEVPNTNEFWEANIFPEDKTRVLEAFDEHIRLGKLFDMVVRYRHKDGSAVWVRCHGKAAFNDEGKPVRMMGAHNDLTALMKVQEDLKKKESILDLLCTTALDGYWDWNMETGELFISVRWKTILGYEDHELENTTATWDKLIIPNDRTKAELALQKHLEDGEPYNVVLRYMCKDGSVLHMLAQGIAQQDEKGEWVRMFGTHTNVSHLEEARAAKQASDAKSTFLATMSHEIRTPLNAVLGMAQALMTTQRTDNQKDCVTTLHNSGAHLLSLINDILDFSQIEAGIFTIAHEDVPIQKTVRDSVQVLTHGAEKKGIALTFATELRPQTKFVGDSERICQIMFNLIGNTVKFTTQGFVGVRMVPKEHNGSSGILIEVKDTGCGMTSAQLEHIFENFAQASHKIRSKYGGSGLGLSISKKLAEAMDGSIEVKSESGIGSVFSLWLPGLSEPDVPSEPPTQPPVFLYTSQDFIDSEAFANGIKMTGRDVVQFSETAPLPHAFEHILPNTIVVIRVRESHIPDVFQQTLHGVLEGSSASFFGVGRRFHHGVPERFKSRYHSLPHFPTSDELEEAFTSSLTPHVEPSHIIAQDIPPVGCRFQILIVEDNLINQKVLKKLLTILFLCDIAVANNGVEGVERAKEAKWDIIFMDVLMPLMDGLEAARIIRQIDIDTPIIALTADATTGAKDSCLDAGMCDFLTKPVRLELLRKCVEFHVDKEDSGG